MHSDMILSGNFVDLTSDSHDRDKCFLKKLLKPLRSFKIELGRPVGGYLHSIETQNYLWTSSTWANADYSVEFEAAVVSLSC